MYKWALTIGESDPVAQVLTDTVGRLSTLRPTALVMGGYDAFNTPDKAKHRESYETLAKANPTELSHTKLRLGGSNAIDDMVYAEDPTGKAPWHERLGGRTFQNPRTGSIGKFLGTASYPARYLMANTSRAPHYDPFTDVAHNPWDIPSVTEHELGHAIDINGIAAKGKIDPRFVQNRRNKLIRDLYTLAYNLPLVSLHHEARANEQSEKALRSKLNKKKYLKHMSDRSDYLPAGYSTYVAGTFSPPGLDQLTIPAAALATKLVASNPIYKEKMLAESGRLWDKQHKKKASVIALLAQKAAHEKQAGLGRTLASTLKFSQLLGNKQLYQQLLSQFR